MPPIELIGSEPVRFQRPRARIIAPPPPTRLIAPAPPRLIEQIEAAPSMKQIPDGIRERLGDERGFVHKKLLGGISKLAGVASIVPGLGGLAGTVSAITGRLSGTGRTLPRSQVARVSRFSEAEKQFGRRSKFPITDFGPTQIGLHDPSPCMPPLIRSPQGNCIEPTSPRGAELFMGQPVMGQYGAGMVAGSRIIDRAVCGRGMQLGNDGVCYNKAQISNKQRMWPAGRKPLLSGGDMRAISTAARAGRRMELATKRLQKMGMMKKPARRAPAPRGHVARLEHASQH